MRNHHVMHTFGRDFGNYRSGHTSTFCRDYFSSHRKAGAQGIRISRMSTVLIVSIQIGKGLFALRIHAYVCNNPSRRWRIVGTELHWCAQRRNPQSTEYGNCKAGVITVYSVLKRVWHRSCGSNQDIPTRIAPRCEAMLSNQTAVSSFWTLRFLFEHSKLASSRKKTQIVAREWRVWVQEQLLQLIPPKHLLQHRSVSKDTGKSQKTCSFWNFPFFFPWCLNFW